MKIRKMMAAGIAGTAIMPAAAAFAHTGGHSENAVATLIHFLTSAPHNMAIFAATVLAGLLVVRAVKKTRS